MLALTKRQALGASLFCLGLLIVGAWALGWIPTYAVYCEQNSQTKHKECATYHIALIAVWKSEKFLMLSPSPSTPSRRLLSDISLTHSRHLLTGFGNPAINNFRSLKRLLTDSSSKRKIRLISRGY